MAGRVAWILAGGAAIVGGMAIQGDLFSFGADEERIERAIEAVDEGKDVANQRRARVIVDGREIDGDAVEAMTDAVADLIEAETALAAARMGSRPDDAAVAEATAERDRARAEVDRLKAELQAREGGDQTREAIRQQIRSEVREAVRNN